MAGILLELGRKHAIRKAGRMRGWSNTLPVAARRRIVRKIAKDHGCQTAVRRLERIAAATKATSAETRRKAKADLKWLKRQPVCGLSLYTFVTAGHRG